MLRVSASGKPVLQEVVAQLGEHVPLRAFALERDEVLMIFSAVRPVEYELGPAQQVAAFVDEGPEFDADTLLPLWYEQYRNVAFMADGDFPGQDPACVRGADFTAHGVDDIPAPGLALPCIDALNEQ